MKHKIEQATIADLQPLAEIFDLYRLFYKQKSNLDGAKRFLFDKFEHFESIIFLARDPSKNSILGFTQLYPVFNSLSMERSLILNDFICKGRI